MVPFSVQNLCIKLRNINAVKDNIIEEKFNFCKEFERELELQPGKYSENLFDFLYNIFDYRKIFKDGKFEQILSDVFDMDFFSFDIVSSYISSTYLEMVYLNKHYFFQKLKIENDDGQYLEKKYYDNRKEIRQKLITEF